MLAPLETSLFDTIAGLPVHPLVVHFAVVLLPLAGLALILLVAVPRWADRYGLVTLACLAVGTGAAFVAKESGEALAAQVGEPESHAAWGDLLVPLAVGLLLLGVVWYLLHRRAGGRRSVPSTVTGVLAALAAIAVTAVTVVVGHSGAEAAWGGTGGGDGVPVATAEPSASGSSSTSGSPSASAGTARTYTMAQVAQHADASSCWSAIDGQVYDLTRWVGSHPGGSGRILGLCGKDGTTGFQGAHGGEKRPEKVLGGYLLGPLG